MEYNEFIDFIYERLHELSPEQKDAFVSERRKEDNIYANRNDENLEFARKLLNVWQNELCRNLNPNDFD